MSIWEDFVKGLENRIAEIKEEHIKTARVWNVHQKGAARRPDEGYYGTGEKAARGRHPKHSSGSRPISWQGVTDLLRRKGQKRPRHTNQLTKLMVDILTGSARKECDISKFHTNPLPGTDMSSRSGDLV
jgi:hypothetical protein